MPRLLPLLAAVSLLPSLASAQTVLNGNHSVDGLFCAGLSCSGSESFGSYDAQKLKDQLTGLMFEDTSNTDFPDRDWRLLINDIGSIASGGVERFSIQDIDADTIPFTIEGDAPENALYVDDDGYVGFGTSLPAEALHVVSAIDPTLRLEQTSGFSAQTWELAGNDSYIAIRDVTDSNRLPFRIETGAGDNRLVISDNGFVGIGTGFPDAPLELFSTETYNYFRITALQAAVNKSVDITFTQGPLGTGQLRYNIVDGDNQEMSLDADGNMVLDGTLTTGGPTCAGGCDAVFTEGQIIPERDYSAQMWADGHLPHVGPTAPGEAFNMTEKMGGMLNALEHAHIYIERQREEIAQMKADHAAQIAALEASQAARLAALEARLMALEAAGQ